MYKRQKFCFITIMCAVLTLFSLSDVLQLLNVYRWVRKSSVQQVMRSIQNIRFVLFDIHSRFEWTFCWCSGNVYVFICRVFVFICVLSCNIHGIVFFVAEAIWQLSNIFMNVYVSCGRNIASYFLIFAHDDHYAVSEISREIYASVSKCFRFMKNNSSGCLKNLEM